MNRRRSVELLSPQRRRDESLAWLVAPASRRQSILLRQGFSLDITSRANVNLHSLRHLDCMDLEIEACGNERHRESGSVGAIANRRVESIARIPETGATFNASYAQQTDTGPDPGEIKIGVIAKFSFP